MKKVISIAGLTAMTVWIATPTVVAQDGVDRYRYCQEVASRVSGYYGDIAEEDMPGGFLQGAVKGGATGAVIGVIGGDDVNTKKAAKNAAILGGLIGAIKRGKAKEDQEKRRDRYFAELSACTAAR